jgi:integrase
VEKLPSGRFRARVVGPDGRYVRAPITFETRTDAAVWIDTQRADMVRKAWRAPRLVKETVGEYIARWIDQHPIAKSSTRDLYRNILRTCVEPDLDRTPLADIRPDVVRDWYYRLGERLASNARECRERMMRAGRAPSSATLRDGRTRQAQAYRLLRAAMTTAVKDGLLTENPCRIDGAGSPRPSVERGGRDLSGRLLTPMQVADVAAAMPERYRALVLVAAWSGLRQGELLALTRGDVDVDGTPPVVHVRRRVRRADGGRLEVDTPKTAASWRTVVLPGPLRDALAQHLADYVPPFGSALVFATARGTVPERTNLNASLRRAMVAAGAEPVRFHDLRHVAQVLAAESGATLAELMARMGHSSSAAALVYMHARPERDLLLAERLGQAMVRPTRSSRCGPSGDPVRLGERRHDHVGRAAQLIPRRLERDVMAWCRSLPSTSTWPASMKSARSAGAIRT